ncbi:MAG: FAD-binding protein [Planctomycetia bacterium]|nr:FAD-binding protein [Planctomycetia bacterium]
MAEQWTNWSGSVTCRPRAICFPKSEDEIVALVRQAAAHRQTVRVAGTGHSFMPLCATDGLLLSLDQWQGVQWADRAKLQASIRGGTKIRDMGEPLAQHDMALANQGDVDVQAIAGAVATGTHGTGPTLGSISTQLAGVRIVTAAGEVLDCSPETDAEVFRAAQVSLGALGVIATVRLKLLPLYKLHEQIREEPIDACLAELDRRIAANRHFEFFWYPARDVASTKTLNPVDGGRASCSPSQQARGDRPRDRGLKPVVTSHAGESSLAAGTDPSAEGGQDARPPEADAEGLASATGERVDQSWRIFPTVRENRFNEMEYSIPAENGPECFLEIRRLMQTRHTDVQWPIEYRTVAADEILISPAHGRATVAISIHQANTLPHEAFFADAERIFRRHAGRPHWGKMHSLTARELGDLYPRWDRFQAVRQRLDPDGRFLNDHLRRLFT